jgi:hypothetical protein
MSALAKPEQIHDLFSVPVGTVPQVDPEHGVDHAPSFPAEMNDYLGKWVAVRRDEILAVADTEADVRKALGEDQFGVTLFHVPPSECMARSPRWW